MNIVVTLLALVAADLLVTFLSELIRLAWNDFRAMGR
jgi:hypothetical protein